MKCQPKLKSLVNWKTAFELNGGNSARSISTNAKHDGRVKHASFSQNWYKEKFVKWQKLEQYWALYYESTCQLLNALKLFVHYSAIIMFCHSIQTNDIFQNIHFYYDVYYNRPFTKSSILQ